MGDVKISLIRKHKPSVHEVSIRVYGVCRLFDWLDRLMMIMVVDVVTKHLTGSRLMTGNSGAHLLSSSAQSRQDTPRSPGWKPSRGEKNCQPSAWLGQELSLGLIRPPLLSRILIS